jgi:hypothetical protein
MLGAYRVVSTRILEKESDTPPITATLEKLTAKAVKRQATSIGGRTVQQAREKIRNATYVGRRSRNRPQTPLEAKTKWLREKIPETVWNKLLQPATTQTKGPQDHTLNKELKRLQESNWNRLWEAYLRALPAGRPKTVAQTDTRRNRPEIHVGFSKPMTALVTQIRTEKIGLNGFLTDRQVPGYSPECPCGWSRQTAKHVILNCPIYENQRQGLYAAAGTRDYKKMLIISRGARAAVIFLQ